ncbi:histidine kinase [Pseudodesulfovibrio sp.]|uniref:AAA family ATPase n=1 Tax=Pseudodesulfovibrio sp. TaxID=2035812 RepID=UPI0026101D93|nr:histidine kinase [Pseudodesulfovibrio sp.]MDD3311550.1 histidine kinase [Pseudodesulfovibrio sp.]
MNNRIIPVTLALIDSGERRRLESIIGASPMVRLLDDDADEMGVLIYEPGPNVDEDMPQIIHALETGQAEDVYLAGRDADADVLIRGMRSGIREFLRYPVSEEDFRGAIMRTAMRRSLSEPDGERGRLVTLFGAKPGLGVTTLATSLAWAVERQAPGSAILVDLRRPAGEAPYFLDLKHEYHWGHLTEDITRLDATYLKSVVATHPSGLRVLPAPPGPDRPDPQSLHLILEQLRQCFECVIVDTAWPDDGELPREVEQADHIFAVTQLTLPCLARTARLLEGLRGQAPDAGRRLRLVANRVTRDGSITVEEAAEVLNKGVFLSVPEDGPAALSALNQGVPLIQAFPKSPASRAVARLARALAPKREKARKGIRLPFAGLFGRKAKAGPEAGLAEAAS